MRGLTPDTDLRDAWSTVLRTVGALLTGADADTETLQAVAEAVIDQVAEGCVIEGYDRGSRQVLALAARDGQWAPHLRQWVATLPDDGAEAVGTSPARPAVSLLRLPLVVRQQVVGALSLYRTAPADGLTPPTFDRAQELAPLLAFALERSHLRLQLKRASDHVRLMAALAHDVGNASSPETVAERVAFTLQRAVEAAGVTVVQRSRDGQVLEMLAATASAIPVLAIPLSELWPDTHARPLILSADGARQDMDDGARLSAIPKGGRAVLPIICNGDVVGAIAVTFATRRLLDDQDRQSVGAITELCAQAIARTSLDAAIGGHEAELALITDSVPALIAFIDADRRYRRVNLAYEAWFARDRQSLLGCHMRDMLGDEAYAQLCPHIDRVLTGETVHVETRVRYPGKGLCWVDALFVPKWAADGSVAGFTVFIHDITGRRNGADMALFLTEAGRALSVSLDVRQALHDVGRLTVGCLADWCAIDLKQPDGTCERVVALHAESGLQPTAEATAKVAWAGPADTRYFDQVCESGETLVIPAVDPAAWEPWSGTDLAGGLAQSGPLAVVAVPMRVMGRIIGVITLVSAAADDKCAADYVAVAEALAVRAAYAVEHARLLEAERVARTTAEMAVQVRDEFLAAASHALRTPVTALHLQLEVIQRRLAVLPDSLLPEGLVPRVQEAHGSVQRLMSVVDTLLDVARLQDGKMVLVPEPVALDSLIRDVAGRYRDDLARSGSTLRLAVEPGLTGCWDRPRLAQVITNLLTNAITFGRGRPIVIAAQREGDRIVLSVADQGVGVTEAERRCLFHQYWRPETARSRAGFGLGLWMVKEIVTLLGGTIDVDSQPEVGSVFRVALPSPASR
jgi:PAS domain S-box-containing protein